MSTEEYTPTTAEVREDYENGQWNDGVGPANTGPQFDRWLTAHDKALIRQHTQTILDAAREATVRAIADAEVRGYQRKVDERITSALAERDRRIRDAVSGALVTHHGMVSTDPVLVAFDRAASLAPEERR